MIFGIALISFSKSSCTDAKRAPADGAAGLQVVDYSDGANPLIVGSVYTPNWAYDIALSGHYAYVADGQAGLAG